MGNRLDQRHANLQSLKRHGETGADHTASHDGDIERVMRRLHPAHPLLHQTLDGIGGLLEPRRQNFRGALGHQDVVLIRTPMFQNSLGMRGAGRM